MASSAPSGAVVVMDRFVSASSSQDAVESLRVMVDSFKHTGRQTSAENGILWEPSWILDHDEMPGNLVWLLQHGSLKGSEIPCEEGVNLVCELFQYLVKRPEALQRPTPGILLESLLDVLDRHDNPIYVRVLALKVLEELSKRHKSVAGTQWLRAPNGLHRLADLLAIDVEANPMEEAIRNQALSVAKLLAREAPMAKVFLFAEVECKLLDLCWSQGGLTKGNPIVIDSLELIQELLRHADSALQDLVWQRPNVAPRLAQLLDLRGGEEFLHPKAKRSKPETGGRGEGDDDDLETLLSSGDAKAELDETEEGLTVPRLLETEERVVTLVLNILRSLLETESLQSAVWQQHVGLCSLVWELALINPSRPPVCALPTPSLQQRALDLVADKFHDPVTMIRHSGLDRLLYLVCTGGAIADQFQEKLGLSQSALAVLRHSLSGESVHDILIRTLAPPPTDDEDSPPGPTVVQKLWNTVKENLALSPSETRTLLLSGSLGGLGLMLCDEESREIMFKVMPLSMDQILESSFTETEEFVQCSLLRFLCEWVYQCPFVAQKLLNSHASTHLAGMATNSSSNQSLVHLLLGLSMESLTNEEGCGGWSRSGILRIITKVGISKYTSSLESLKSNQNPKMPWLVSEMEFKSWKEFCSQAVLSVRKRVVEELASGSGGDDGDSETEDAHTQSAPTSNAHALKPLQRMISQQAKEMDGLRRELKISQAKVVSQEDQLVTWRRRMESTPTQLDAMLNELTANKVELQETIQSLTEELMQLKAEKAADAVKFQAALSESKQAVELLERQSQEARDDLERSENEMKALSQAYASLEEDYQRNLPASAVGAPTGEASQQQGEVSRQQNVTGSTEVATLRAENSRLRNDARAADEWMAMAVQRMNEMGAANGELEQRVESMRSELANLGTELTNAQRRPLEQNASHSELRMLQSELAEEKAMRTLAEQELLELRNAKADMQKEQQRSAQLERRLLEIDGELNQLRTVPANLSLEQERSLELAKRLEDAEQEIKATAELLTVERNANHDLEKKIGLLNLEIQQLRNQRGESKTDLIANDSGARIHAFQLQREIDALPVTAQGGDSVQPETGRSEVEEFRRKSEQDIYRLESVIRELEDRLGSGLGEYNIDDIRTRDLEIEELRKANEAAQDWMTKAVDHHQMLSAQVSNLSKEKSSLTLQLDALRSRLPRDEKYENDSEATRRELDEKIEELKLLNRDFAQMKSEFDTLKREKKENQGFLDELGIAMEDVGIMQERLSQSQNIVRELEEKLAASALNAENEALRVSNQDLENKISEFQSWTDVAQTKIAEIMASRDEYEVLYRETQLKLETVQNEVETLKVQLSESLESTAQYMDAKNGLDVLQGEIAKLECANETLQNKIHIKEEENSMLLSRFIAVEQSSDRLQKELSETTRAKTSLESALAAEKELSLERNIQNEGLNAHNIILSTRLEQAMQKVGETSSSPNTETIESAIASSGADDGKENLGDESALRIKINELSEELRLKNNDLDEANKVISQYDDIVQKWADRVSQLESELALAQQQLVEQEKEANDAINMWHDSYTSSEEKCTELEETLRISSVSVAEMKDELNTLRTKIAAYEDEKESFVVRSAGQIASTDPLEQLKSPFDGHLQARAPEIAQLQNALKTSQEIMSRQEEAAHQWRVRTQELEEIVGSLQAQLNKQEVEAIENAGQWQERCVAAEKKISKLQEELDGVKESNESLEATIKGVADQPSAGQFEAMLQEKEEELQRALQHLRRSQSVEVSLKAQVADLEEDIRSNQHHIREKEEIWEDKISAYVENCHKLEKQVETAKSSAEELQRLRAELNENVVVRQHYEDQMSALQAQLAALSTQLEQQEAEANSVIQVWEEQFAEAEEDNKLLSIELEKAKSKETELSELRDLLSRGEEKFDRLKEEADDLSSMVASLEKQLKKQTHEASKAAAHAHDVFLVLEGKHRILETEIADSRDTIARQDWTIEQLKAVNELYNLQFEELKSKSRITRSLEADVVSATAEISQLTEILEAERQTRLDERERLMAELAGERGRHAEARDEIEMLSASLEQVKIESEQTITQWTVRYQELYDSLGLVQQQLLEVQQQFVDQEREANEAISVWELKAEELENALDHTESELKRVREILVVADVPANADLAQAVELLTTEKGSLTSQTLEMQSAIENRSAQVKNLELTVAKHETRINELGEEVARLEAKCRNYADSEHNLKMELAVVTGRVEHLSSCEKELNLIRIERDRMQRDLTSKSREKLEEERRRLELVIAELEAELRDASDLIQAYCTNASTDNATEVAAQALREEIDELKNQLNETWQKLEQEKAARDVAELEIGRLRDDIAALVSVSDEESTPTDLKKLTTKAIEKLQKRERVEIDELRKSLFRALEELEISRCAEKDANEKLAKVRLQISIYEQEMISAKSEINFVTQAMEELREAEESKRASLEYQIGMLGNEKDVLRKYHAAELESVRNELAQIAMEKDRVLHQLKESEKTNSSLLFAASKGDITTKGIGDLESECAKLRVENAHLLTMAAEDKARCERRVREILAVHSAASEVDVILEHELRVSAEAALETLRLELDDLRLEFAAVREHPENTGTGARNRLEFHESESLHDSIEALRRENANLKTKMKEAATEATSKIETLTEECHALQAKLHRNEREGRFEVAVQSEIARMRLTSVVAPGDQFPSEAERVPSVDGQSHEVALTTSDAYDLIQKQRDEIEEERKRHREDIAEYEGLFALLAQQDLENKCLKDALIEVAGVDAAREAVRNAEVLAATNYGTVVRVNG